MCIWLLNERVHSRWYFQGEDGDTHDKITNDKQHIRIAGQSHVSAAWLRRIGESTDKPELGQFTAKKRWQGAASCGIRMVIRRQVCNVWST